MPLLEWNTIEVVPSYGLALGVLRLTPCILKDNTSETCLIN